MDIEALVPAIVTKCESIFSVEALPALDYDDPDYEENLKKALYDKGVVFSVAYLSGEEIGDPEGDLTLRNRITIVISEDRPQNQTGKTVRKIAVELLKGLTAEDYPGSPSPYMKDSIPIESEYREDSRLYVYFVNIIANTKN